MATPKQNFPIRSHGYDVDAVDRRLLELTRQLERLEHAAAPRPMTSASEQVQAIVEAAQRMAEELRLGAEERARRATTAANEDAERVRREAAEEATAHVQRVAGASAAAVERLVALQSQLDAVATALQQLHGDVETQLAAVFEAPRAKRTRRASTTAKLSARAPARQAGRSRAAAARTAPTLAASTVGPEAEVGAQAPASAAPAEASAAPAGARPARAAKPGGDRAPSEAAPAERSDLHSARLIVLNMALNGTSRNEAERYLADNFRLPDPTPLLDEIYRSVEG